MVGSPAVGRKGIRVFAVFGLAAIAPAAMACCPSDGHTVARSMGMESEVQSGSNLSSNSGWRVYAFERDGIRYLRVDDVAGNVVAVIGYIQSTFFVLPMGSDADRVQIGTAPAGVPQLIYRSNEVEINRYETASGARWSVSKPGSL